MIGIKDEEFAVLKMIQPSNVADFILPAFDDN